jgi:hypothetical protein
MESRLPLPLLVLLLLASVAAGVKIAVPAYFRDAASWKKLRDSSSSISFVVANGNNGPDRGLPLHLLKDTPTKIFGYVRTGTGVYGRDVIRKGARPLEAMVADAKGWFSLYPAGTISGIFLDESPSMWDREPGTTCAENLAKFRAFRKAVQALRAGATIVINPGSPPCESFMANSDVADVAVLRENVVSGLDTDLEIGTGWVGRLKSPDRFWLLAHGGGPSGARDTQELKRVAAKHGAGLIFTTDRHEWNGLPSPRYWEEEVQALSATPAENALRPDKRN